MHRTRHALALLAAFLAFAGPAAAEVDQERTGSVVRVTRDENGFVLLRNGEPYFVRGAGGQRRLDQLVAAGGNSIRTWSADHAGRVLDEAHRLGLTVTVGIWVQHPRHGFDYHDTEAVERQREMVRGVVEAHRHHPALLAWGVGNEVELASDPDLVFPEINHLANLIKSIDPDHPTMAVLAGPWDGKIRKYIKHCPDVDLLGINAYGGVGRVPIELEEQGYTGPYLITEFGPRGHWEIGKAPWGAPLEPTSSEKAATYLAGYQQSVAEHPGWCLGSYVFLWGQKQETTSTWYGMFLPTGESTEMIDVMHRLWSGREPEQRAPSISPIESTAALATIRAGEEFEASVRASDPDGDPLEYHWEIVAESTDRKMGGDPEKAPPAFPELTLEQGPRARLRAPATGGNYRIFVRVMDGTGRAATANVPFRVE